MAEVNVSSRPLTVVPDYRSHRKVVTLSLQARSNSSAKYPVRRPKERSTRSESVIALEELVQCGICQDQLSLSRMLPCQHTFCLTCLQEQVIRGLPKIGGPNQQQQRRQPVNLPCAICRQICELPEGVESLTSLPPNMYIENLLAALSGSKIKTEAGNISPTATTANTSVGTEEKQINCAKCRIVCVIQEQQYQKCLHCKQPFCNICWVDHVADLEAKLTPLAQQLQNSQARIQYKQNDLKTICSKLEETVRVATEAKIAKLRQRETEALEEVARYRDKMADSSKELEERVEGLVEDIVKSAEEGAKAQKTPTDRVAVYIKQHRATSKLLDEITRWGEVRPIFNPNTIKIEQGEEKNIVDEAINEVQLNVPGSPENHYKQCLFQRVLTWEKCPKPGCIRMAPWDQDLVFIAGSENEAVMIFNVAREKLVGKLAAPDMRCPTGIAFSERRQEIYVTDKWTSKIFIFNADGEFKNVFQTKYQFRNPHGIVIIKDVTVIVCDTGHDRVVILDIDSGNCNGFIGYDAQLNRTILNTPSDITASDKDILILDSGNQRVLVHTYDPVTDTYRRSGEFGSMGYQKGQFVWPEVVHLDNGNVLVGDRGSGRLQVFDLESGQLLRVFDDKGGFKSVTGITVRGSQVIISDHIGKKLHVFDTGRNRNRNII